MDYEWHTYDNYSESGSIIFENINFVVRFKFENKIFKTSIVLNNGKEIDINLNSENEFYKNHVIDHILYKLENNIHFKNMILTKYYE